MAGDSNDESDFPHKLFLRNTQVSRICIAFANGSSDNIKFSKTQLSKNLQLGGFLDSLPGLLLKTGSPLMKNALKSLAKIVLIPLELTAASATDAAIQNKIFGSGMTLVIILIKEIDDIMKIVKYLVKSDLLIKV